jgi:hypothetical protein
MAMSKNWGEESLGERRRVRLGGLLSLLAYTWDGVMIDRYVHIVF